MSGRVFSHWFCIRSSVHPTAAEVAAGQIFLGTDGTSLYMTDADGNTTVVGGSAASTDINIDDNTDDAFRVRQNTDHYIEIDTLDGTEKLVLGNFLAGLSTELKGNAISATATDSVTVEGGGDVTIDSTGGTTEIRGSTIRIGQSSQTSPIYIGTSGARNIRLGHTTSTELLLRGNESTIDFDATGLLMSVKDGEEFLLTHVAGTNIISTDFGAANGNITIGDVTAFPSQDLICDVHEVQVPDLHATGASQFDGEATFSNNIVLNDGGSLKEGGGQDALTIDGSGHITRIGQSTPSLNYVLQWDGAKAVWGASPSSGGANALSDLSDVGDVTGSADGEVLMFVNASGEYENTAATSVVAQASLSDLSDVSATAPSDGEVLTWDNGGSRWISSPASAGYSDAQAISAVEGEGTLDLTGEVTTQDGTGSVFAHVGGGSDSVAGWRVRTDTGVFMFPGQGVGKFVVSDGNRYDIYFSGRVEAASAQPFGQTIHLVAQFRNPGSTNVSYIATSAGLDHAAAANANDGVVLFTARLSVLVLPDPAGPDKFLVPSGSGDFIIVDSGGLRTEFSSIMVGHSSARNPLAAANTMAVPVKSDQTVVECGFMLGSQGTAHSGTLNATMILTGAWMQAFPGGAIHDPDLGNGHPT